MHDSDPYGSGFDLFVAKSLPYGLAFLVWSSFITFMLVQDY